MNQIGDTFCVWPFHLTWYFWDSSMLCISTVVPFYCWVLFHCISKLQLASSLTFWWTFGLFQFLTITIKLLWTYVFVCIYVFISFEQTPSSEVAGLNLKHMFNFNSPTLSKVAGSFYICAINSYQHLVSNFNILVTPVSM